MKLRAIRLANVGTFADPAAIEGMSGGLDLLIGPNEMGKSTILGAVRTLFTERHTVTGRVVESMRARSGSGEPVVEADFDAAGTSWRVTKRYGKGKSAVLADRASGRIVAEGPEAEEQLARLVAHGDAAAGGIALLWADQGTALVPKPPEKEARSALAAAIEREVETAADGGMARKLRAAVQVALAKHVPPTGRKAKAGSDYERALRRCDDLKKELLEAQAAAAAAAERLTQIARLRDELNRLDGVEAAAARRAAREKAGEAYEAGARAAQALSKTNAEYQKCAREAERADAELKKLDADLQAVAGLQAEIADARARLAAQEEACAAAAGRIGQSEQAVAAAAGAESAALTALLAAERREATEAARHDLATLQSVRATAGVLTGELAEARRALQAIKADAAALQALEKVVRDLDAHAARLAAGAPRVRIEYEPGKPACISVSGETIADGSELIASAPLQLIIPGVGSVTVLPAANSERQASESAIRHLEWSKVDMLTRLHVENIDAARSALTERQRLESEINALGARLAALAPDGVAALDERIAILAGRVTEPAGPGISLTRQDADAALASARENLKAASAGLNAATKAGETLRADQAALKSAIVRDEARLVEIAARLPPPAVRFGERARRASALDAVRIAERDAYQRVLALKDTAPDEAALAALGALKRSAEEALVRAGEDTARLRQQIERLEGAQENADEHGVATRADEVAGELQRAEAEVARFKREVAELELVAESLARAEAETRDRFLRPVTARIAPFLDLVFPAAVVNFDAALQAASLQRAGIEESIARLSTGTQEQLAILIRLGFARLLAETGSEVPLILDDALVYSDDDRIRRMFAALELAAGSHQVLVLTCRESAFAGLGGHRLTLSPWKR